MANNQLLPCPFCGGAARIESSRDWHRLYAAHGEDCMFADPDDHMLMYPAQPGYLIEIAEAWNRRAAPPLADDGLPPERIEQLWDEAGRAEGIGTKDHKFAFAKLVQRAAVPAQTGTQPADLTESQLEPLLKDWFGLDDCKGLFNPGRLLAFANAARRAGAEQKCRRSEKVQVVQEQPAGDSVDTPAFRELVARIWSARTIGVRESLLAPLIDHIHTWASRRAAVSTASAPEAEAVIESARFAIEAMLKHFTKTPSTLADSTARSIGHQAILAIEAHVRAAPSYPVEGA